MPIIKSTTTRAPGAAQFVTLTNTGGRLRCRFIRPSLDERATKVVAQQINEELDQIGKRLRALILDFSEVQMMSSLGLALCIDARNRAERSGAKSFTVSLRRELRELFTLLRVDRLFTMAHDEEELTKLLREQT